MAVATYTNSPVLALASIKNGYSFPMTLPSLMLFRPSIPLLSAPIKRLRSIDIRYELFFLLFVVEWTYSIFYENA
jgi:hypothetical protein